MMRLGVAVLASSFWVTSLSFTFLSAVPKKRACSSTRSQLAETNIQFDLLPSILDIPAEEWNSCLSQDSSPFLEYSFLKCLEESKCVSQKTGWIPSHVSISTNGEICGFVPLYIKMNSRGEFVFDSQWAEAAQANDIKYYPKLLVGVPFTPVTCEKILLRPNFFSKRTEVAKLRKMLSLFLKSVAKENKLSSVHINFLTEEEAVDIAGGILLDEAGSNTASFEEGTDKDKYHHRTSIQYHWTNSNSKENGKPYRSFDEYLQCFKSKRRITIRRERQKVLEDEDIRIDAIVGKDILKYDGLVERMFAIYRSTIDKMFWGNQYLSLNFFKLLSKSDFIDNICFLCVRRRSESFGDVLEANDVIAGTFNVIKNGVFYGRYWGALEEVKNLHFECCYWAALEYCIENGLRRMEPGAGGSDYKWARGFDPALIHSVHYITNSGLRRAVKEYIHYETENNLELQEYLIQKSVVGSGNVD